MSSPSFMDIDATRPPPDDTPLTIEEIKTLVRGFVRFTTMLRSAEKVDFDPAHFNGPDESPFCFFMTVYKSLLEAHGAVTKDMFLTQLAARREDNLLGMSVKDVDFLFGVGDEAGFIDYVFEPFQPLNQTDRRAERSHVESILKRFLRARVVKQALKRAIGYSADNTSPAELNLLLRNFSKKAQSIEFVGNEAINAAPMPLFGEQIVLPPVATPTTIGWIDNYIGGFREGDIIGLLGPYSGGKSTMLSTVAVRMAQQYAATGQDKLAVYICYEDGAQKVNYTLYSAAAHIERDAFTGVSSPDEFWAALSTPGNLKPYELTLPMNINGDVMLCERERWAAVAPWYNRNFCFLDFSANEMTGGRGNGGVQEIVATLENLVEQTGLSIGFVAVDYAVIMVNRELSQKANLRNMEQIWRPLQMLPDELKSNVAVPFGCTILLAHQLAGSDIKHIPAYRHVTHFDAQGSKAFAENLHACVCLNAPDPESRVSTINWSKIRFGRPASPYGLVQIDEKVVDVRDVSDEYYVNDLAKRIMRRNDAAPTEHNGMIAGPASAGRRIMRNDDEFGADTFGQDLL